MDATKSEVQRPVIDMLASHKMRRYARNIAILAIDSLAAGAALSVALLLRMNGHPTTPMMEGLKEALPLTIFTALSVFYIGGLHRRVWRFVALADVILLVEAATVAVVCSTLVLLLLGHSAWMPLSLPIIQWFVLVVFLGSVRAGWRIVHQSLDHGAAMPVVVPFEQGPQLRTLIAGSPSRVEMLLHQLELAGEAQYRPVGILDLTGMDVRLRLRGVPILGAIDALEHVVTELDARGLRPDAIILAGDASDLPPSRMLRLVAQAQGLGLHVARSSGPAAVEGMEGGGLTLQPVNLADLLDRPQTRLDEGLVQRAITGRRVLVTGAGGTIGRELVRQIAAARPSELILLDAGEFNLYSIDLEIQEHFPDIARRSLLCSIRQRQSVMDVFATVRPELVFHAAALKHVPLVEHNPCAGVMTNVLGTRNVADAAQKYGALAMVQVSTDKAVNPVGVMGATKRLGELYCQALDLANCRTGNPARFMTVRFGNVLGSSGSLIPLFQRQLEHRKPLTVTHPDIERYFMTVHEAVQLTLQSTARGMEGELGRGRIFVLDMGAPIKIMDIARRMIRLSGLVPDVDVKIEIVGLRPGEKLYEELFDESEKRLPSLIPGVLEAEPRPIELEELNRAFDQLAQATYRSDRGAVVAQLEHLVRASVDAPEREDAAVMAGLAVEARQAQPVKTAPAKAAQAKATPSSTRGAFA